MAIEPRTSDAPLRCSFCNKDQFEVRKLIAGPAATICDECVEVCTEILAEDSDPAPGGTASDRFERLAEFGLVFRCALCGTPTSSDQAVPIPERGPICPGCLGEVEAAGARKRDDES
jgi:hypothetical protein